MTEQIRIPERAAGRIAAALQRLEIAQAAARETAETVADALGVPPGWVLGGDGAGLYFAPGADESSGEPMVEAKEGGASADSGEQPQAGQGS